MRHPRPRLVASVEPDAPEGVVDEEGLEDALRGGRAWAEREVLDRYTGQVQRILVRILGASAETDDLTQEVFLRGLDRISRLRAGTGLRAWFTGVAVNVAREMLRARARRRWLLFFAPQDLPAPADAWSTSASVDASADASRALRATYEVLAQMGPSPRTLFALRHLDGMELGDLSRACGMSVATVKRRLARAEATFRARARRHPLLRDWLDEGEPRDPHDGGNHDDESERCG